MLCPIYEINYIIILNYIANGNYLEYWRLVVQLNGAIMIRLCQIINRFIDFNLIKFVQHHLTYMN